MWKLLSKSEALKDFNKWSVDEVPEPSCEREMLELRQRLIEAEERVNSFINISEDSKNKEDYIFDLRFGLELYNVLEEQFEITTRDASNDEVWIYLSMKVVPDIIYNRWGMSDTRFFKQSRRIWLKTLWWYIHLSWNGSIEETYNILKKFTTDEIVQLVERSGPNGYRIDVTREIMKQFGNRQLNSFDRNLFRKVMKLNTARVKIVEPALTSGGTKKYVEELINYFEVHARI